uniref:Uncharacterized protein n=2 Tax=Lutzomyia longipalpis TaxID=7200 RepID=A0A7G3AMV6_LUTLO
MTTREQRQEYSSNVVRVLHPSRPLSPTNAEFDSNLDYLLDDLQQSVSRPGSSLGQNASSNLTSSREIQYLSPQNSSTVVRERSISPSGQKSEKVYKTSSYEYKTSSSTPTFNANAQANISQLDSLLDDLKHEREVAIDKLDRSTKDNDSLIPGSTKIIKTTYSSSGNIGGGKTKPAVQRELHFETSTPNKLKSSRQEFSSSNYETKIEKSSSSHGDTSYGSYIPEKLGQESRTMVTKSYNQSKSPVTTISNVDGGTLLHDIPVESDILPRPGTKVTTTVRTYTYEVPDSDIAGNHSTIYRNESFNRLTNDTRRKRDLSPSVNTSLVTRTENTSTLSRNEGRPVSPSPPMKKMYYQQDTLETTKTRTYSPTREPVYVPPPVEKTVIYKHDTTDTSRSVVKPPPTGWKPNPPAGQPGSTFFYREETNTTTNKRYPPPHDGYAPPPDLNGYPPVQSSPSVTYKYSSHTTTTNNVHRLPPDEVDDGVRPAPFPTDGIENVPNNTAPPKRLDDLLASFGDSTVKHYHETQIAEKPYTLTKDSLVETASPDQKLPTKNVAGPPVYYPPGELFLKKEESGAAWRAQGGYARGAGKYQYESEEKSKSKSKSGGAVVPVCLPLCCAMPCSIM